jgi:2-oxoglutarate ferredoxin oxidoreductase subunit alpha
LNFLFNHSIVGSSGRSYIQNKTPNAQRFLVLSTVFGGKSNPSHTLDDDYAVHYIEMSKLVTNVCEGLDLPPKTVERTKNLCALGVLFWMYDRPLEPTIEWLNKKFKSKPKIIDANTKALHAGYNYGETAEITTRYIVEKASLPPLIFLYFPGGKLAFSTI